MNKSKKMILCSDDFGLSPSICQGILKLARMRRLSAVSCMANATSFEAYAKDLLALSDEIQVGLHFNLTEGSFLSKPKQSCFSLKELLLKTHLGLINKEFIAQEFNAQLDHYIQIMGGLPDFIDGHQHVHQFPQVRGVILRIYEQRLRSKGSFIRATFPAITAPSYQLKGRILALTGGKTLHSRLVQHEIPHNHYFSGVYDFASGTDYRTLFNYLLRSIPTGTLIMCHPGDGGGDIDPIADARLLELSYFSSDEFLEDCSKHHIELVRK